MPFLNRPGRRDPDWGLDGSTVRVGRRRRRFVASTVLVLSIAILALILARLPSVDVVGVVNGPNRLVVLASLAGDAIACCLIFAQDSARRSAMRRFGGLVG